MHNRAPVRILLFRGGVGEEEAREEHGAVREGVFTATGSAVTYICLSKDHSLRTFNQFDSNYVSKDTCKRVQTLFYAVSLSLLSKYKMNYTCSCN